MNMIGQRVKCIGIGREGTSGIFKGSYYNVGDIGTIVKVHADEDYFVSWDNNTIHDGCWYIEPENCEVMA